MADCDCGQDPLFLDTDTVLGLHDEQIARHGGEPGVRDSGLLESALVAPQNKYLYDDAADIFDLAACYCSHIAGNHPFHDGNKRTALAAALTFLDGNGIPVVPADGGFRHAGRDEFLANLVIGRINGMFADDYVAEMLFFITRPERFSDCMLQAATAAIEELKASPSGLDVTKPDEAFAIGVDACSSRAIAALIELCQAERTDARRLHKIMAPCLAELVSQVAPEFQRMLGMVVRKTTDNLPG